MRSAALFAFVLAAASGIFGCSRGDGAAGPARTRCEEDVEITVVPGGLTPSFTWEPACGAAALLVEEADGGDVWYLDAATSAGILPPVRYGTVPPEAVADEPAAPLVAGRTYYVFVAKGLGAERELAGLRSFAP